MMKYRLAPLAAALVLSACASSMGGPRAVAQLQGTTGSSVSGTVNFVQNGDKVMVSGEVRGLKPNAEHGFHVHEKGDCSSGDGMSTGGHFNPGGQPHGNHATWRTMPVTSPASRPMQTAWRQSVLSQEPLQWAAAAPTSWAALIVHRDPDDYKTQPTGNAGPRLACAVIKS